MGFDSEFDLVSQLDSPCAFAWEDPFFPQCRSIRGSLASEFTIALTGPVFGVF
jgi:hypothetical protein